MKISLERFELEQLSKLLKKHKNLSEVLITKSNDEVSLSVKEYFPLDYYPGQRGGRGKFWFGTGMDFDTALSVITSSLEEDENLSQTRLHSDLTLEGNIFDDETPEEALRRHKRLDREAFGVVVTGL